MSAQNEDYWSTLPLGRGVVLLNRDANGLAAFSKPSGVLSHPNGPGEERRSLLTCRYDLDKEFFQWTAADGSTRKLWLLNRLDSATSGVILACGDETLAVAVKKQFATRRITKTYQALVFGTPAPAEQHWRDMLSVEKRQGAIRTRAGRGNVPAESRCKVLCAVRGTPSLALLLLEPKTGRSHQLRVQCAKRGLPIVGDQTYGDFKRNRDFAKHMREKRLFLHSAETEFEYEAGGKAHHFRASAPIPPEFALAME